MAFTGARRHASQARRFSRHGGILKYVLRDLARKSKAA
jgi:hypothetical protein